MARVQIKVIEREHPEYLEVAVNEFLDYLETDPLRMTFCNSFATVFDGDYEGDYTYYPRYTAII